MLFYLIQHCKVKGAGDEVPASTESGFSALINVRLALGCWSHIKGMSFILFYSIYVYFTYLFGIFSILFNDFIYIIICEFLFLEAMLLAC